MRFRYLFIYTLLLLFLVPQCQREVESTVYKLYFLGGQSNMDGFGFVNELPEELNQPVKGVMIFHGNTAPDRGQVDGKGLWSVLCPGHGTGFKSDGIVWMQGESDGFYSEEIARKYKTNLKRLMDLIRAAFRTDDLPVVIGRISDSNKDEDGKVWNYGDIIRKAQADFVDKDTKAALVISTDNYQYSDPWHYDTQGYIDLGKKFAEALFNIQNQ